MTKWYEYSQNNSGGHFDVDEKLCHRIFIEADSLDDANKIAESLGIYFNGCDIGMDCSCCGDRWSEPFGAISFPKSYGWMPELMANEYAQKYGTSTVANDKTPGKYDIIFPTIESFAQFLADKYGWTRPDCRVYYKSGQVVEIFTAKSEQNEKI